MTDPRELVGKHVVVQNPNLEIARWEGRAIAYAEHPTIEVEQADGTRISLPAAWASAAEEGDVR